MKGLIKIFTDDYIEAKNDMKKNDPNAKWLMLAVVVLIVIGGIIDAM